MKSKIIPNSKIHFPILGDKFWTGLPIIAVAGLLVIGTPITVHAGPFDQLINSVKAAIPTSLFDSTGSDFNKLVDANEFEKAIHEKNKLLTLYPDAYKYSDCNFLKGHAFEKIGLTDSSKKSFDELVKLGVEKAKFQHYIQMQVYCLGKNIDRALYVAVCKTMMRCTLSEFI